MDRLADIPGYFERLLQDFQIKTKPLNKFLRELIEVLHFCRFLNPNDSNEMHEFLDKFDTGTVAGLKVC